MLRLGMNKVFIGMLITAGALIFTLFRAVSFILFLGFKITQIINILRLMERIFINSSINSLRCILQ